MIHSQRQWDCGVCAVANALNISWWAAASRIFSPEAASNKLRFSTKTRQIALALDIRNHKLIRVKSWAEVPEGSVVKVMPPVCEGTGDWHWVAYRRGRVWCSCADRPVAPKNYLWRLVSYIGASQ